MIIASDHDLTFLGDGWHSTQYSTQFTMPDDKNEKPVDGLKLNGRRDKF